MAPGGQSLDAVAHLLADAGAIPNNPRLPLLIYPQVLDPATVPDLATAFEERFTLHGWPAAWRNGIYRYPHFHSTAHEVLGIAAGRATVRLGGDGGITVEMRAGDAVLIPAGVGHQKLGASSDLLVVGAYPDGQTADLCRSGEGDRPWLRSRIAAVPRPERDPLQGSGGAIDLYWPT